MKEDNKKLRKVLKDFSEGKEVDKKELNKAIVKIEEKVGQLFNRDTAIESEEKIMKIKDYESVSHRCKICSWNVELSDFFCKHCGQRLKG